MSEIKVNSIKGVAATTAALSINNTDGTCTANISANHGSQLGNRRVNINGDMQVWQRSTSASDIGGSNGYFACDRYRSSNNGSQRHTISRSTDTPNGFGYSMKIDVTTANASPSANNYVFIQHRIEGQDVQGFAKGSSDAKVFALSFHVKSPKAGIHIIQLEDVGNTRSVSKSYTVNTPNTWEKKTILFPADTTGAITADNANRLQLYIWLMAGSTYNSGNTSDLATTWAGTGAQSRASGQVNCFDNLSNDFLITGIQLEVGGVTDFEHRSYGQELQLCKRYFQNHAPVYEDHMMWGVGRAEGSATGRIGLPISVPMRAAPTVSAAKHRLMKYSGTGSDSTDTPTIFAAGSWLSESNIYTLDFAGHSSLTHNNMYMLTCSTDSIITLSSEL
tara:strand:- start:178 stop:1350 length:1173 start_codon:yes stop_codon:yes gene_type:complete